jgi:hypothetical protein
VAELTLEHAGRDEHGRRAEVHDEERAIQRQDADAGGRGREVEADDAGARLAGPGR